MASKGSAARHTFYYLLILVSLGFAATGIGQILFEVIEYLFPDPTSYYDFSQWSLRFGISSLIVTAPIYWFITRKVNTELSTGDLDPDSIVRKWLTYLIVFISSVVVIGDLMAILQDFLSGELTVRFFLKCLIILVISGLIFSYYLYDIRREKFTRNSTLFAFHSVLITLVLGSLIAGIAIMDSPFKARLQRQDGERVNRLSSISYQVQEYYRVENKLPQSLEDFSAQLGSSMTLDPVTNQSFEYRALAADQYELCAVFELASTEQQDPYYQSYSYGNNWSHESGRQCFQMKIDLEGGAPIPIKLPPMNQ